MPEAPRVPEAPKVPKVPKKVESRLPDWVDEKKLAQEVVEWCGLYAGGDLLQYAAVVGFAPVDPVHWFERVLGTGAKEYGKAIGRILVSVGGEYGMQLSDEGKRLALVVDKFIQRPTRDVAYRQMAMLMVRMAFVGKVVGAGK